MSEDGVTVRLWARAFTRELDVAGTIEGFRDLAGVLGEPNLVPVHLAELTAQGLVQRVALSDPPQGWMIQLTSESLDVQYTPTAQVADVAFESFCKRAAKQLGAVLCAKEAKAHRVAVLWERLLPPLPSETLEKAAECMLHLPGLFQGELFEWDWRAGVRYKRSFGGVEELTNTIATVKRVEARVRGSKSDRLLLVTDVNTDHRKISARLTGEQVQAFVEASPAWHDEAASVALSQMGVAP